VGDGGTLVVVADELDRPVLRKAIEAKFGRIISTPQPEPLFNIVWVDGKTLTDRTRNPLFLMAASLTGQGPTTDLLSRMLTPDVREGVEAGEYSIFTRCDPWARRQLLLLLVGRTRQELGRRMDGWVDTLYQRALDFEYERIVGELVKPTKHRRYERKLNDGSGFSLRLQIDYIESQGNDSLGFVRFIRHHPERWIMVAWGELDSTSHLAPGFIYNHRKSLGEAFLDPVMTYDDRWEWEETTLNGFPVILVRGLWATIGPIGGGPFFSYCLAIPEENRYYIIDGAVLAPGEAKMVYLWQLEAIVHTFERTSPKAKRQ